MRKEKAKYLQGKLISAIRREDLQGVRKWLNEGASPNRSSRSLITRIVGVFWEREESPLTEAIVTGSVAIVRELLEAGANANEDRLLVWAYAEGMVEIVDLLLSFGAKAGKRELAASVQYNRLAVAELLLGQGVDVEDSILEYLQTHWWRKSDELLVLFENYGFEYTDEMRSEIAERDKHLTMHDSI